MDKKCRELTEQYFNDPESKYPDNKKQLLSRSSFSLGIPIQMVLTSAGSIYATLLPSCLVSKIQRWMLAVHGANDIGVIPYSVFAHIENAHCWAHAQANLRMPLQPPGSDSCIGENYF
jgi:hypothetical protein